MFQEPHNTYTVGVRLYGPSRVDTHVAGRRDRSQLWRPEALMPRLSQDEEVQLWVEVAFQKCAEI